MSEPAPIPALPADERVPSASQTLRRLFLTLFLRGRSARGLQKKNAPGSIAQKLALTLVFYALIGCLALSFVKQSVFMLSVFLHAMSFAFVGLFVASSAGEILFNKEEADILLHRPIEPKELLWAKVRVLVEVSLWLSCAFNLVGFFVGAFATNGGWSFPLVHLASTALEALFCAGSVIMIYQLCLRWLGRERLEGMMTTAQVVVSVGAVLAGQLLPQAILRMNAVGGFSETAWWIGLLPPAWFAGFDDALAGSGSAHSWFLAAMAVIVTATVLWLAFGKLARDYEFGLQILNETIATRPRQGTGRSWTAALVDLPPLRWLLRDPVVRASFSLTLAYLARDRDMKLRIYPGLVPLMIVPVVILAPKAGRNGLVEDGGFPIIFASIYLCMLPLLGLNMLQYSQQWQAADIFRVAPMAGPARLCQGARLAFLTVCTLPVLGVFALGLCFWTKDPTQLFLLLPSLVVLPAYSLIPHFGGKGVPLSLPVDEAKSVRRGASLIGVMFGSVLLAAAASAAWSTGWFLWFLLAETVIAAAAYVLLRRSIERARWTSLE